MTDMLGKWSEFAAIKLTIGVLGAIANYLIGPFPMLHIPVASIILIDFITGSIAAVGRGEYSSYQMRVKGVRKIVGYLILYLVALMCYKLGVYGETLPSGIYLYSWMRHIHFVLAMFVVLTEWESLGENLRSLGFNGLPTLGQAVGKVLSARQSFRNNWKS